jgi:hypothetical protein
MRRAMTALMSKLLLLTSAQELSFRPGGKAARRTAAWRPNGRKIRGSSGSPHARPPHKRVRERARRQKQILRGTLNGNTARPHEVLAAGPAA